MSCIEAETVVATEAVAGAREASPAVAEEPQTRDAIGAEQEAGGPCRVRHAAVAASDGKGNCIEGLHAAMRVRYVFVERRRIAQQN